MAEWNKGKVLPSAINGGQEFTTNDNLAINELNAIVNNSFYATNKSDRAEELAESAVKGNGSLVTINGQIQGEWSADFAESERQKSITDGEIVHEKDLTSYAPTVIKDANGADIKFSLGTENTTDSWLLVFNNNNIEHRDVSSILESCLQSKGSITNVTPEYVNNLDLLYKKGVYDYFDSPTGLPSGFAGWGVVIIFDGGTYKVQIVIGNFGNPRIIFRNFDPGTNAWSTEWNTIF